LFELQGLRLLGYEPALRRCVRDQAPLQGVGLSFSPTRGGALCPRCAAETPGTLPMSGAALEIMRRLIEAVPESPQGGSAALALLRPTETQRSELAKLLVPYVRQRSEAPLRSLGFIEELRVAPPGGVAKGQP
jgi:DNA repair protein RecO (recombination protein O)